MRKLAITAMIFLSVFALNAKESTSVAQDGAMTSLSATPMQSHVLLSWSTNQSSVEVYELERSKNGVDFSTLSRIEPGSVNTEYMETDFNPMDGMSYYRLKVINADGDITYSNAVPVKYAGASPVSPSGSKSRSVTGSNGPVIIVARNKDGEEYYSKVEVSPETDPMLVKDLEARLSAGTYTIVSCSVQEYFSRQIVVK